MGRPSSRRGHLRRRTTRYGVLWLDLWLDAYYGNDAAARYLSARGGAAA